MILPSSGQYRKHHSSKNSFWTNHLKQSGDGYGAFGRPPQPTEAEVHKPITFCSVSPDSKAEKDVSMAIGKKQSGLDDKFLAGLELRHDQEDLQELLNYIVGEALRVESRVNKLYWKGQTCLQDRDKTIAMALEDVDKQISLVMVPNIHDL